MPSRKLSPPVHWFEGMFLQPQHLQVLARQSAESLDHRARLLSPYLWGFGHLEVSDEALAGGRLSVPDFEAILPDGSAVQAGTISRPLERDLEPFEERLRDGERIRFLLAVPEIAPRTIETADGDDAGYPLRYRAQPAVEVLDETDGSSVASIHHLRWNASLLASDEDRTSRVTLPIVEIAYEGDVLRRTEWVPPTLLVTKGSPIGEIVRKLCQWIRGRATEIAGGFDAALRHREAARTLETRFQAYGFVASLLPLEQMVDLECCRPVDVYLALCRVLGELTTLSQENVLPAAAPRYDHLDLHATFAELDRRIRGIAPTESNFDVITTEGKDGKFKVVGLGRDHLRREMYFTVRAGTKDDRNAIHRWVETNCIIANRQQWLEFEQQRVLGIERELLDPPPVDLPHQRGDLVYRLRPTEELIRSLESDPMLVIARAKRREADASGSALVAPRSLDFYVRKEG